MKHFNKVMILFFGFVAPLICRGMEEIEHVVEAPKCPKVTYGKYLFELRNGETIDGFGSPHGNIGSWLKMAVNKNLIHPNGKPLQDLKFFREILYPVVEGSQLRCNYSLSVCGEDFTNGSATLSLFRDASHKELEVVQKLPKDSEQSYDTRKFWWRIFGTDNLSEPMPTQSQLRGPYDVHPTVPGGPVLAVPGRVWQSYNVPVKISELVNIKVIDPLTGLPPRANVLSYGDWFLPMQGFSASTCDEHAYKGTPGYEPPD